MYLKFIERNIMPDNTPRQVAEWGLQQKAIENILTQAKKSPTEIAAVVTIVRNVTNVVIKAENLFQSLHTLQETLRLEGIETYHKRVGAYYGGKGDELEFTDVISQRHLDASKVIGTLNTDLNTAFKNYKKSFETINPETIVDDIIKEGYCWASQVDTAFTVALNNKDLTTHRNFFSRIFEQFKALCNHYLGTNFEAKMTNSEQHVRSRYVLLAAPASSKPTEEPEAATVKPK
jgi:hypothetical protein